MSYWKRISARDALYQDVTNQEMTRFKSKILELDGCHLFQPAGKYGYGIFYFRGVNVPAHRFALFNAKGSPRRPGMYACHSCRNRNCVNSDHLSWQTPRENNADMVRDNTHLRPSRRGERHHNAKLTAASARSLFVSYMERKQTVKSLAAEYGVHEMTVHAIGQRRTWQDATNNLPIRTFTRSESCQTRGENHGQAKLTENDVREIKSLLAAKKTQRHVAKQFSVSQRLILNIAKGRAWAHVT